MSVTISGPRLPLQASSMPANAALPHSLLSCGLLSDSTSFHTCAHLRAFALADPTSLDLHPAGSCYHSGLGSSVTSSRGPLENTGPHPTPSHPSLTITSHCCIFFTSISLPQTLLFMGLFGCLLPGPGKFWVNQTDMVPALMNWHSKEETGKS